MKIIKLVFIRHGESQWNKENKFTGWIDVNLSNQGRIEAQHSGQLLKDNNFIFDYGYTSVLTRSIHTLWIILDQLNQAWLPVKKAWQLNERHYGLLQGLNKNEAIKKYGYETVQQWRRSFDIKPPAISKDNDLCGINDIRYSNINVNQLPNSESLLLTSQRIIPYWNQYIIPNIKNKKRIIIVAHGNSIRAIVKFLNNLNSSEIFQINIPTAIPLIYEFDIDANPIKNYYLT